MLIVSQGSCCLPTGPPEGLAKVARALFSPSPLDGDLRQFNSRPKRAPGTEKETQKDTGRHVCFYEGERRKRRGSKHNCAPPARRNRAPLLRCSHRSAGYSDEAVAEVVAHISLNVLTNFFNSVAETEIDFPQVEVLAS